MPDSKESGSIFSHKLDRVAFTAYFLGAIVPLVALGTVVESYVFPTLTDPTATWALMGALASIAVLSLASFQMLRRSARRSLQQMDDDNRRLEALFQTADALSRAQDEHEAGATAAACALDLAGASAAYAMTRGEPGQPPQIAGSAGEDPMKLYRAHEDGLLEVARLVLSEGRPVLRGADGAGPPALAVAIPGDPVAQGVLVAVRRDRGGFSAAHADSLTTLARLAAVALHNIDLRDAQRNFFTHVTDIVVTALDAHLGYHTGHSQRVAQFANRLGRALQLDEQRMQRLHFGALLHDIGLLKIDRAAKKNSLLCQKHTVLGYRMLHAIRVWQDVAPIVHHHHEWYDGNGYPEGLAGEAIPLEARIVSVCDAFDTMTSDQSYKAAVSMEAALRELDRNAGTQFDPRVVAAFQELAAQGAIEVSSSTAP
jgi:putative nucleotidyltransferase with HDIG domain